MGGYLVVMLGLGWAGRISRREESLKDFYLGGSSFGVVVLFLTLFATQYSGNTLLGFAGRSYQQGLTYVVSVTFMILVVTVYLAYAPRLFRLARRFGYITPADYVFHRFGSHRLRVLAVLLLCWGLANYILEQLVAMGHGVEAISGGRIGFMQGVLMLAVVHADLRVVGGHALGGLDGRGAGESAVGRLWRHPLRTAQQRGRTARGGRRRGADGPREAGAA